eukprot:9116576-Alexandrium_andersonii.AAC.1
MGPSPKGAARQNGVVVAALAFSVGGVAAPPASSPHVPVVKARIGPGDHHGRAGHAGEPLPGVADLSLIHI